MSELKNNMKTLLQQNHQLKLDLQCGTAKMRKEQRGDIGEGPGLLHPDLTAGEAAEAPICCKQGAPEEPQQLSPAIEAEDGQPAVPDGGTYCHHA